MANPGITWAIHCEPFGGLRESMGMVILGIGIDVGGIVAYR